MTTVPYPATEEEKEQHQRMIEAHEAARAHLLAQRIKEIELAQDIENQRVKLTVSKNVIPTPNVLTRDMKTGQDYHNLVAQAEKNAWKDAFGQFMSQVVSALSRRTLSVQFIPNSNAVAYTDGVGIFIGGDWFDTHFQKAILSKNLVSASESMMIMKGLVLHELSHILWSPRLRTKKGSKGIDLREQMREFQAYGLTGLNNPMISYQEIEEWVAIKKEIWQLDAQAYAKTGNTADPYEEPYYETFGSWKRRYGYANSIEVDRASDGMLLDTLVSELTKKYDGTSNLDVDKARFKATNGARPTDAVMRKWLAKSYEETLDVRIVPLQKKEYVGYNKSFLPMPRFDSHKAFNMLEDSRIEMLFLSKYPDAKPYFVNAVLSVLLTVPSSPNNPGIHPLTWLICYGRKYLDQKLVDMLEEKYEKHLATVHEFHNDNHIELLGAVGDQVGRFIPTDELKVLIDKFLVTSHKTHKGVNEASQIIARFTYHMDYLNASLDQSKEEETRAWSNKVNKGGNNSDNDFPHGAGVSDIQDEKDLEELEELLSEMEEEAEAEKAEEKEKQDSDEGSAEDAPDSSGEKDEPINNDSSSGTDKSKGAGKGYSDAESKEVEKSKEEVLLNKIHEAIKEATKLLQKTSVEDLKSVSRIKGEGTPPPTKEERRTDPYANGVTVAMSSGSKEIQVAIQKLWSECEPAWEDSMESGRLNINNAMASASKSSARDFRIFDQWNDLGEANDFDIVILADQSGSMGGSSIESLSKAIWMLRDVCKTLAIPLTVFGYSDRSRVLYSENTKAIVSKTKYDLFHAANSTCPDDAIRWASQKFSRSKALHKLLFSLTDGEWHMNNNLKVDMAHMQSLNVESFLGILPYQGDVTHPSNALTAYPNLYGHKHYLPLPNITDFPSQVAKIIARLSTSN